MTQPHDPTASTRPRTDVFPVSDRDADALDAWLDQQSAPPRAGESSTPVEPSTFDHNGHSSAAAATNDTFPLTAAAQQFHARLDDAERDHAPDVPEAAIWEKVMSNHLALEPTLPATRPSRTRNTHLRAVDASPHPLRAFVGSNPAISAIFAIVLVIALVAVFRGMSENGSGPNPTAPTGGENHLAAITNATPDASGTPQANSDCVTTILTEEESAKIVSEWQAAPAPQWVPIQGPASASDADAASATYVKYFTCKTPKNVPSNLLTFSLSTTRSVFKSDQTRNIDTYVAQLKQQLAESQALSSALGQHYTSFVANADDPAVKPYIARNTTYGGEYAVLPEDFVVLADGRIGALIKTVLSTDEAASRPTFTAERQAATFSGTFIIFANVNGAWLIDDTVALCMANCDQFFAKQQAEIDRLSPPPTQATPSATVIGHTDIITPTPKATAPATPNAAGTPQANSACVATNLTEEEAAKIVSEWQAAPAPQVVPIQGSASATDAGEASNTLVKYFSCIEPKNAYPNLVSNPLMTTRSIFQSDQTRHIDTYVALLKQQLAESQALSSALGQHYTTLVANADDPAVKPYIVRNSNGEFAVLPQDFVVLADGRIGAPLRAAPPVREGASTPELMLTNYDGAITFIIFANVDGKWLIDETVALCVANCDQFFATQQAEIDRLSPQPTNASPSGTATTIVTPTMMPSGGDNQRTIPGTVSTAETSTPNASATAQANGDCVVRTLTAEEVQKLTAQRLAAPEPTFLPTQGPAPESEASAAITTYDKSLSCHLTKDQPADLSTFNLWSDNYFAESRLQYSTENRIVMSEQRLAASQQLSPVLVDQDPTHSIVDSDDPAMQQYIIQSPFGGNKYVLLPQDFVVLADGRIGAPLKWAFPGGTTGFTKDDYTTTQSIPFLFFANVDGKWLLDQQISLCTWKCDQYYSDLQSKIDQDRKWLAGQTQSTPSTSTSSPQASTTERANSSRVIEPVSSASPAADPWLQPVTVGECVVPSKSIPDGQLTQRSYTPIVIPDGESAQSVAKANRSMAACGMPYPNNILMAQFKTHRFQSADESPSLVDATIANGKSVSQAMTEQGAPPVYRRTAADDDFRDTSQIREYRETATITYTKVFAPEDAIEFNDGRIGIPTTFLIGDSESWDQIQTYTSRSTALYIWVDTGSIWKLDEILPVCFGDCDAHWSDYANWGKTQSATPSGIPSASNPWLQPITADECAVPAPGTGAQPQLSPREDRPISVPDPNDSEVVASTARDYLACSQFGTGNTLDPFRTDRFQMQVQGALANNDSTYLTQQDITSGKNLSAELAGGQGWYQFYVRGIPGADNTATNTQGFYEVALPANALLLPDGRIAMPIAQAYTSDDALKEAQKSMSSVVSQTPYTVNVIIFASVEGTWKVDQQLPLCLQNCSDFWQQQEASIATPSSPVPLATPAAATFNADHRRV